MIDTPASAPTPRSSRPEAAGTEDTGVGTPHGLPVLPPRNALVELAVFVLVIGILEWALPQFDVNLIQPNPCWLPVLLLSLQYGTVSGMLAAGVAIVITALGGFPEQEIGENHFAYLLRIWGQPMLWITAALLLGQFRMRQIAAKLELARQVASLAADRTAVAAYATRLRERCEELERRSAGRSEPLAVSVLAALTEAGRLSSSAPEAQLGRLIDAALPGAKASLYRRDGDVMRRIATAGHAADRLPKDAITSDEPLPRALAEFRDGLSVLSREGEAALAREGLAAVPILSPNREELAGMLKIETMPAELLGTATLGALAALAAALAPAVTDAAAEAGTPPRAEDGNRRSSRPFRFWRELRRFGRSKADDTHDDAEAANAAPKPARSSQAVG